MQKAQSTNINLMDLDTPALIVDIDLMITNLKKMRDYCNRAHLNLRPHTKAHKCPDLAKLQLQHGAKGICCAKLGEAEVMASSGLTDILITTPVANEQKIRRIVELKQRPPDMRLIQVVDHPDQVAALGRAMSKSGLTLELLIEVDSGQKRCGVEPGQPTLDLARRIAETKGLKFSGIQCYSGHVQHVHGYAERKNAARKTVTPALETVALLQREGFNCDIVSGGGTGTYDMYEGLTINELQAGSYLFMDSDYLQIGSRSGDKEYRDFACALQVLATVISVPTQNRAIIDAGMKALSIDSGMPLVKDHLAVLYRSGGDEHGILDLPSGSPWKIGEKLLMIPSHCDTTLNQFDWLYGIRNGRVESVWNLSARGRSD